MSLLWSLGLQGRCGSREKFGGHCKEVFSKMLEISLAYYSFVMLIYPMDKCFENQYCVILSSCLGNKWQGYLFQILGI